MDALDQLTAAVLYEGYVLWPYRRSARKNQQRWTFGGVYPRGFVETARSGDAFRVQTQCLVTGSAPQVEVELRFLHIVERRVAQVTSDGELNFVDELVLGGDQRILTWDEAAERRFRRQVQPAGEVPFGVGARREGAGEVWVDAGEEREVVEGGVIVRRWAAVRGALQVSLERLGPGTHRVTVSLENTSPWVGSDRAVAQRRSFLSAHCVLQVRDGEFVSATDPPPELAAEAAACANLGLWPVLVGAEGERHTLLASPIILYDYPRIAPESPGDLFDSGEIDQLLILNTLTLTDAEKAEVRATDPRAREILDRAERLTAQDLAKLHGAIRELRVIRSDPFPVATEWQMERQPPPPVVIVNGQALQTGSQVRLHPRHGADIFDLALDGRLATVESIEQDYDERVHLAVTLADDPGRDLGAMRMPGHRFFFSVEEVEPAP